MSAIDEFCEVHGPSANEIADVVRCWIHEREVDDFLATPLTAGVLLGDLICGDGLQDQISPQLLRGFSKLMGERADTYDAVRRILLEKLDSGDASVRGIISKIQGQIGENEFLRHAGETARLAESGSQEGWDIAVGQPDDVTQWVQVKTYSDANDVMKHIHEVQDKVTAGQIFDADQVVTKIDFAVPENIVSEVQEKVDAAGLDVKILAIPMSSDEARSIVSEGVQHVGPESLSNFFGELLGATLTAAALHGAVNAFLVYKGAKERSRFVEDTSYSTGVTSGGLTAAFATEAAFHKLAAYASFLGGPTTWLATLTAGITARMYLSRVAARRFSVKRLIKGNEHLASVAARMKAFPQARIQ